MGWNKNKGSDKSYVSVNLISEEERAQKMKLTTEAMSIQREQLNQKIANPQADAKPAILKEAKPAKQDARV
jgi:hypothetical protein